MHGEYKVPGGKLVVVDLDVVDGKLANFHLAGDFFLEPDTALEAIDRAVNGLSAESSAADIAAAVKGALPEGAILLGFSPEGVAVAIRRSLAKATSWRDYDWQIVHSKAVHPVQQMALDEVLATEVGEGRRQPDDAHLGVGGAGRRHRQLPVREERGRRREREEVRLRRRAAHLGRRGDVHGGGIRRHVLDLRAGRPGAGDELRRQLRLPRRVGADRPQVARHRRLLPAAQRHHEPEGQDRRRRTEASRLRCRAAPRHHELRHGRPEDDRGAAGSAARRSATRASPAPPSASTRCAARPGSAAPRSSSG